MFISLITQTQQLYWSAIGAAQNTLKFLAIGASQFYWGAIRAAHNAMSFLTSSASEILAQGGDLEIDENATPESAIDNFLGSDFGKLLGSVSRILAVLLVLGTVIRAAMKAFGGRGAGGGSFVQALKPLGPAIVIAVLLFNLKWPVAAIALVVNVIDIVLSSIVELIPGIGDSESPPTISGTT